MKVIVSYRKAGEVFDQLQLVKVQVEDEYSSTWRREVGEALDLPYWKWRRVEAPLPGACTHWQCQWEGSVYKVVVLEEIVPPELLLDKAWELELSRLQELFEIPEEDLVRG